MRPYRQKLPNPTRMNTCAKCDVNLKDKWWIQRGNNIYCEKHKDVAKLLVSSKI